MAEFFLFILMVVVFCAWLHHKTGIFENLEIDNTPIAHEKWQKDLEEDLKNNRYVPGSYFYNPDDIFPLIKDD